MRDGGEEELREVVRSAWVYCCRCWCQVPLAEAVPIGTDDTASWLCRDCAIETAEASLSD